MLESGPRFVICGFGDAAGVLVCMDDDPPYISVYRPNRCRYQHGFSTGSGNDGK